MISSDLLLALLAGALVRRRRAAARRRVAAGRRKRRPAAAAIGPDADPLARAGSVAAVVGGWLVLVLTGWLVWPSPPASWCFVLATALFGGAGEERAAMRRLEAPGRLDRVAARHDRRRGRPGAGDPGVGPRRGPRAPPAAGRAGRPAALPDAAARRAAAASPTRSTTPRADLIVAALILNARLRGPGLRDVLGALAKSAREEVDMRHRVDGAAVVSTRRSVQIVVVVSVGVRPRHSPSSTASFVEPYGTLVGPGRARRCLRSVRARLLVAAQAVDDRDAGTLPGARS